MEILDKHVNLRREMHDFYNSLFSSNEDVTVFSEINQDYFSNYWLSTILFNPKSNKNREELRLELEKDNIESRPLWKPMHLQPIFKDAPFYGGTVSESLFNFGLCLPSGSNLSKNDKERIKSCVSNYFNY